MDAAQATIAGISQRARFLGNVSGLHRQVNAYKYVFVFAHRRYRVMLLSATVLAVNLHRTKCDLNTRFGGSPVGLLYNRLRPIGDSGTDIFGPAFGASAPADEDAPGRQGGGCVG